MKLFLASKSFDTELASNLAYIAVNQEYTSLLSVTACHSHPILKPQTLLSAQMKESQSKSPFWQTG